MKWNESQKKFGKISEKIWKKFGKNSKKKFGKIRIKFGKKFGKNSEKKFGKKFGKNPEKIRNKFGKKFGKNCGIFLFCVAYDFLMKLIAKFLRGIDLTSQKEKHRKHCNIGADKDFGVLFNLPGQEFVVIFILEGIGQA